MLVFEMQPSSDRNIERAHTFDQIAELYDRGRREPPDWPFDELFSISGIEPAFANVLEIGCGTGKSTLPLARRGCNVVALDMGPNLTRVARRNLAAFPRVRICTARFEDRQRDGAFDLVVAITVWHWLDPHTRYEKAAAALRPRGFLAFTTGGQAFPPGFDPFFAEIQSCYKAIGEDTLPWPPPPPESITDARSEIVRSGLFYDIQVLRRVWSEEFTADEHVALMRTASDHQLMESE